MATEIVRQSVTVRLAMPVSTPPGPSSAKLVTPASSSVSRQCFQRTGLRQLGREQARPVVATVVGHGVDVGDDRHVGVAWLGLGERVAEPVACRRHERRVERPRHLQRHDLLRPEFLGVDRCGLDALGRSGDHDLARCVEVGDPHVGVGPSAGDLDLVVVEPEHGRHRSGLGVARVVHRRGASDDEAYTVVEAERAGGGERRVLAEAVTGAEARLDTETLDRIEHHQAGDERGELGVAGVAQFVGIGVAQQLGDVAPRDVAGLVDELPALVIAPRQAHAGSLRPLAGEGEGEHSRQARPMTATRRATAR